MFPILKGKKKNENSCFFKGFWITEIDGGSLKIQRTAQYFS
jgi:hypothetical protein